MGRREEWWLGSESGVKLEDNAPADSTTMANFQGFYFLAQCKL